MKIGLIGTHGTRKTTLLYALATEFKRQGKQVGIVEEVARNINLPINKKTTVNSQLAIINKQLAEEITKENSYELVLTDRTALDNYAYYLATVKRLGVADPYPELKAIATRWLVTFHKLVFCEPDIEISVDGVRDTDTSFQFEIHNIIESLLEESKEFLISRGLPFPRVIRIKASHILEKVDLMAISK